MKVRIGPYTNWFGPYQLAESICFWAPKQKDEYGFKSNPDWVHNFGGFLAHGFAPDESHLPTGQRNRPERATTWLDKSLTWIHERKKRTVDIKIDKWDTWSMDATLSLLILPMLKQLKATKHGSGMIDLEDVPEHLRVTTHEEYDGQSTFDFYHENNPDEEPTPNLHTRYDWILDELIWTFEQLQPDNDWEAQYHTGEHDTYWEVSGTKADGTPSMYQMMKGPDDTHVWDKEGYMKHSERINNGLCLFGKYYRTLWD